MGTAGCGKSDDDLAGTAAGTITHSSPWPAAAMALSVFLRQQQRRGGALAGRGRGLAALGFLATVQGGNHGLGQGCLTSLGLRWPELQPGQSF
jgi:hypothetical protein